jgi:DNA-binding transcriptional LysR family regulator
MDRFRHDAFVASMNGNVLRTYLRVVELGSITRAAQSLYLAQSAVSGQIASLASAAGGMLLERRGGRLVPTRLGRTLHEGALDLLARATQLERQLRDVVDEGARSVTVSCTHTVCETPVARIVSMFGHEHPDVRLRVSSGTLKDVQTRLRSAEADVALVEGFTEVIGCDLFVFHVDRLVLAVPPGHPLARAEIVRVEEMAN